MKKISKRFKGLIEQQKKEKIDSLEKKIDSVKKCQMLSLLNQ